MKLCSKCKNDGPFKGSCNYCQTCQAEYFKARYETHYRAGVKERRELRVRTIVAFIQQAKEDKPCADCNIVYPYYVMDFDHVRGIKVCNLSRARDYNLSLEAVQAEIDKCDLVCANCHRERSFKRQVAPAGLEPAHLSVLALEASASTNSAKEP